MRERIKTIVCLFAVFYAGAAFAQLKTPSEYVIGELANGTSYYIVKNTLEKGHADIALIQRQPGDVRASLDTLPLLAGRTPWKFLSSRGVTLTDEGYVSFRDGAAVYNFTDIPVSEAFDSTLFLVSCLSSTSPCRQALVVCGDVDVASVTKSLQLLSLPVTAREELPSQPEYVWTPRKERKVSYRQEDLGDAAIISINYFSPSLPREAMNTVRPFISEYFSECLSVLLESRLKEAFYKSGVAFGGFSLEYLSSGACSGDERHTINIITSANDLDRAGACMGKVLYSLAENGISEEEYGYFRDKLNSNYKEKYEFAKLLNSQYVENCVRSYLYGMSLVSRSEARKMFDSRVVDLNRRAYFFNEYFKALVGSGKNGEFVFRASSRPDTDKIMSAFDASGHCAEELEFELDADMQDKFNSVMTLMAYPAKLKSSKDIKQIEGKFLTFSNGSKVAFKKSGSDGMVDFSLMLKGGVLAEGEFCEGESAFVQDIFSLCNVAGIPFARFARFLSAEGITLKFRAGYSNLIFYGSVPAAKVKLLIPIFTALQQLTPPSKSDIENYLRGIEPMEQLPEFRMNSRIDSLLRPEEKNYTYKYIRNFKPDTAEKIVRLVKSHLERSGDAVLVLIGDITQDALVKQLSKHIGVFRSSETPSAPSVRYPAGRTATGTVLVTGPGLSPNSVRVRIEHNHLMSRDAFLTFRLASMCLNEAMSSLALSRGFSCKTSERWSTYPEDHFIMQFDFSPCPSEGLPASITVASAYDVLADMHTSLKDEAEKHLSHLPGLKALLLSRFDADLTNEHIRTNYLIMRYAEGRDMSSEYKSVIESISEDSVREAISEILSAGRVEYITPAAVE